MDLSATSFRLSFGPFELYPARRQLLQGGQPVHLGGRALDLLIVLTERAGELISRSELESRLWPTSVVEETSLRVHVSALRKALAEGQSGARYISNVPGRGYRFVAPLARAALTPLVQCAPLPAAVPEAPVAPVDHRLPGRLTRVIGRAEIIDTLTAELGRLRLVSLVGAGGMGKTTVALSVAERRMARHGDGVRFIDLSPLSADSPVLPALVSALGLDGDAHDIWTVVTQHLGERRMLLVLDNCEHVIRAAAELVERLLAIAPRVSILATSREALNVDGERVHRLAALQAAAVSKTLTVAQALAWPALQLFVERAEAHAGGFALDEGTLPHVRSICHRLDGIPLAIELAAARVDTLGVEGLASRLDDMFELLTRGRRTALPRHRTLQALLDWSHDLLGETERAVLRRLSLFRSSFSLDAAASVCSDAQIGAAEVIDCVMSLAAQSLVVIKGHDPVRYRLLYTTRTYAARKLAAAGEQEAWSRRHAEHLRDLFAVAPLGERMQVMDDVRAALDWTLSPHGDPELGVTLVATAQLPLRWVSVVDTYRLSTQRLLEKVRRLSPPRPELELRLVTSLTFLSFMWEPGQPKSVLLDRARALGPHLKQADDLIGLHYGLSIEAFSQADYAQSVASLQRIREFAVGPYEPLSVVLVDRLMALNLHHLGDHRVAGELTQRVLAYRLTSRINPRFDTTVPHAISMGNVQARILWLQGCPAQASEMSDEIVDKARNEHLLALLQTLGLTAVPMAIWRGELSKARRLVRLLRDGAERLLSEHWLSWARDYERVLQFKEGSDPDPWAGGGWPANQKALDMLSTLVPQRVSAQTAARAEAGAVGWCAPETLRAWALNMLRSGKPADRWAAEQQLLRAQALAVRQGALAWQLRIACSLATLWHQQGRHTEARALLETVLGRCREGRQDADQVTARDVLASLASPAVPVPVLLSSHAGIEG